MKNHLTLIVYLLIGATFTFFPSETYARDGRSYVKDAMKERGQCRTVAITEENGDAMIFADNGYAYSKIPTGMADRIKELNGEVMRITDIHLSDDGKWIIIYGKNGFTRSGLPYDLDDLLVDWNENGYTILSASFDDMGHWIAISDEKYCASDSRTTQWIADGCKKYGKAISSCISHGIAVVVYERGYQIMGNAPYGLVNAIKTCGFKVRIIKATKSAWFISDGIGSYRYYM